MNGFYYVEKQTLQDLKAKQKLNDKIITRNFIKPKRLEFIFEKINIFNILVIFF